MLSRTVAGVTFPAPVLLAAGTAGFGRELAGTVDLARVGGLVTKAVSLQPRCGNRAPRVAEVQGGMLNSVGLANPGVAHVRDHDLPWLADHQPGLRVIVNVVGFAVAEYADVIAQLDHLAHHVAYEINLSCPNTSAGGIEFGADAASVADVIGRCRAATGRPLFAKLSPVLPDIPAMARVARDAGADGVTLLNTLPATARDGETFRVGHGSGGLSGPALRPVALLAVERTARALPGLVIIAAGGAGSAADVRDYLRVGASLVAIGTAALATPRRPERIVRELERHHG